MNRLIKRLLLPAVLGIGAYAGCQQYGRRDQLSRQLQQLDQTLSLQTDDAATRAGRLVQGIEVTVMRNQRQPRELTILHQAEALELRGRQLLDTISARKTQLRQATGNPTAAPGLLQAGQADEVARLLRKGTRRQLALHQQLTAYAGALRQFGVSLEVPFAPSAFDNCSVVEELALLTELQSAIVGSTTAALRHLAPTVGAQALRGRLLAVATAESPVVAPGETYRGQVQLVGSLSAPNMKMDCDGQPVPVSTTGVGQVRFRAPTRPGPTAWTGTIRIPYDGRDTAFSIRVPYRVAPR